MTFPLGEGAQLLKRTMHEPGVGGMGDRLRLHGGVHHHPLEILAFQRPGLVAHLLQFERGYMT